MDSIVKKELIPYKGYLNPKNELPRESILFHFASVFLSLIAFIILLYSGAEPIMTGAISVGMCVIIFLFLFRINNHLFKRDRALLENYILVKRLDQIDLLGKFFNEIQHNFETASKPYFGNSNPADLHAVNMQPLFVRVFREEGDDILAKFHSCSGNFLRFLQTLDVRQREVLLRFYMMEVDL